MTYHHFTLIHGIFTGLTKANWTEDLAVFLRIFLQGTAVIESESYKAGAIPPWNLLVKNPVIARALARRGINFQQALNATGDHAKHYIIAHSNGTNIAARVAKTLVYNGVPVEALVLIGSALNSNVERNGLLELVQSGGVRRVFAYCSGDDRVIRNLEWIPGFYGSLGARGFHRDKKPTGLLVEGYSPLDLAAWEQGKHRFVTRNFPHFDHGDWFEPGMKQLTSETILADCGLAKPSFG